MSYREVIGLIASGVAVYSYFPYLRDVLANKTKPHAFSWLIWSILTAIAFFGQLAGGAGPGAWVNLVTLIFCFVIFVFGLIKGRANIVFIDWICLAGALISLFFWFVTKGPMVSMILITVTDALGFLPTFRKSYHRPHEETVSAYVLSGLKYVFSFFALNTVSVVTALFPVYLIVANWSFVVMVYLRKKQLRK